MLGRLEEALERERGFVADAGHELRTPLALLRTELELALRHAESADELRDAIRHSSVEVDRLAQLAEDLLLIAQSQAGRLPLRLEPLAPAELLATTASRFEWRAREAGRTVTVDAGAAATFQGDPIRLEQALGNLVDNALRHGDGQVRLAAASANGTIELHVTDTGAGLPEGFAEHAFERFSQPDPARGGGGSGLGLAIVQMIAEAHGGSAHVANRPGGGADAWMEFPVAPLTKT
jgi:signal transduction histidine kinase